MPIIGLKIGRGLPIFEARKLIVRRSSAPLFGEPSSLLKAPRLRPRDSLGLASGRSAELGIGWATLPGFPVAKLAKEGKQKAKLVIREARISTSFAEKLAYPAWLSCSSRPLPLGFEEGEIRFGELDRDGPRGATPEEGKRPFNPRGSPLCGAVRDNRRGDPLAKTAFDPLPFDEILESIEEAIANLDAAELESEALNPLRSHLLGEAVLLPLAKP